MNEFIQHKNSSPHTDELDAELSFVAVAVQLFHFLECIESLETHSGDG